MEVRSKPKCELRLEVPFHDLDPLRVVWHGNYLKYFELARDALFKQQGLDLFDYFQKTGYVFPIIKTSVKYIHPLRYNDEFMSRAQLVEAKVKIVIDFEIVLAADNIVCARGRSEQAAVKASDMSLELVIPEKIRIALGET
ncbi:MAG: acyl-CoA thioesterase [Proteobacteria bacterium]|nr:acyl-CoA thioesterase [Pseudomonadota bacterium]